MGKTSEQGTYTKWNRLHNIGYRSPERLFKKALFNLKLKEWVGITRQKT